MNLDKGKQRLYKLLHKEKQNLENCTKYEEKFPQESTAKKNYGL